MPLRHIHVETTMFENEDIVNETQRDLCWWLEALTQRNQSYLKARPNTPPLYRSGVVYERPNQTRGDVTEVRLLREALGRKANRADLAQVLDLVQQVLGGEHFCDIGVILERGAIDCDGLACWRAAELRQLGVRAVPWMTHRKANGGTIYHALVRWPPFASIPYETSEDPSLLLGMGGEARAADRRKEIEKNVERCEILAGAPAGSFSQLSPFAAPPPEAVQPFDQALADVLGFRGVRYVPARRTATAR